MMLRILLLVYLSANRVDSACTSKQPGDTTEALCSGWCSAAERAYDCSFCACRACPFCSSGDHDHERRGGGSDGWHVPREACALDARADVMQSWGAGFRLGVRVGNWVPNAVFTVDWGDSGVKMGQAFAADVVRQEEHATVLQLRKGCVRPVHAPCACVEHCACIGVPVCCPLHAFRVVSASICDDHAPYGCSSPGSARFQSLLDGSPPEVLFRS
eukprot:4092375-Pleurochrysis_carterae.AAC.2